MTWSSQVFDDSQITAFRIRESCKAQPELEPAWRRPACLFEVAELKSLEEIFRFLRDELQIPLPIYNGKPEGDPCYTSLRFFYYKNRPALERCLTGIWNLSFSTAGKAQIEDCEKLLKEAKVDLRNFAPRKRPGEDGLSNSSTNTSFSTVSSFTSPETSFSGTKGLISLQTSFSADSSRSGTSSSNDWQKGKGLF